MIYSNVLEALGKVRVSSEHLLSLINDVLDMSRVESGRVKIEEEPAQEEAVNFPSANDSFEGVYEPTGRIYSCPLFDSGTILPFTSLTVRVASEGFRLNFATVLFIACFETRNG
mgnify:CR=1 FL=1